jgi:predicted metal-dependent enzyme (double-stranded beta helix superfamily)
MAGGTTQMHIHASLEGMSRIQKLARRRELFGGDELLDLTIEVARQTKLWLPLVRHTSERRWYEALVLSDALELWLIGWAPGQATPTHDHGGAKGALTVAAGDLLETVHADPTLSRPRHIARAQGSGAHFSPHHIHRVANEGAINATSIHAYSPAGLEMRIYDGNRAPQLVTSSAGEGEL